MRQIDYYDRGRRVARLEMGLIADLTRYPFRIHNEQRNVTADMAAALSACSNATMHLGAGVTAAENTASGCRLVASRRSLRQWFTADRGRWRKKRAT